MMTFDQWYKKSQDLDKTMNTASAKLKKFPRGNTGLTPDSVKNSPEYKKAKSEVDRVFNGIRQHNSRANKDWLKMARDRRRQGRK